MLDVRKDVPGSHDMTAVTTKVQLGKLLLGVRAAETPKRIGKPRTASSWLPVHQKRNVFRGNVSLTGVNIEHTPVVQLALGLIPHIVPITKTSNTRLSSW